MTYTYTIKTEIGTFKTTTPLSFKALLARLHKLKIEKVQSVKREPAN